MTMDGPARGGTVSVVIPAHRAAATIARAVDSALAEAVVAEVIVVLDGPDDVLHAAVPKDPKDPRVRLSVLEKSRGAAAARNAGLALAAQEFVLFLDADDFVEDGLIAALAAAAGEADLAFGPFAFAFPSGRRIEVDVAKTIGRPQVVDVLKAWFRGDYVPCCAVLWRTRFVRAIGGWAEDLLRNQDGELVWRACLVGPRLALAGAGRGIYMQSLAPGRVSATRSRAMYEQQFALFARTEAQLAPWLLPQVAAELGGMYYRLARTAYYDGLSDIGRQAEFAARHFCRTGQDGTRLHRLVARLIGLENKERLCSGLHRTRHAVGLLPPSRDLVPVER